MTLLKELLSEARRKRVANVGTKAEKAERTGGQVNNFVAKHSQNMTGAGAHEEKNGKRAPRHRQKRDWKKDARNDY